MRGYMNFVERVRRDNTMLASFLIDGRGFIDEAGHVVLQFQKEFAITMLKGDLSRLASALSAELKRPISENEIILEAQSAASHTTDTVLDDLLNAAEQQ